MTGSIAPRRPPRHGELWQRVRGSLPMWPGYAFLALWIAFTLFAFLWIILTSFKSNRELFANVWSWPMILHLENYQKAWSVSRMGPYFLNSLVVVTLATIGLVIVSAPASYVLSRVAFRGREALTQLFVGGMGIPRAMLLVPMFMLLKAFGLTDSLFGLGTVYVAISLPFTVFMLTAFFGSLPTELEEAAAIDGASSFLTFLRVMLPLAGPGLSTAFIFNFIWLWKDYFWALVLISSDAKKVISLGLYSLQGSMQYSADWVGLFAGCVIVMVPTLLLYVWMSEKVISGITVGAVKS